MQTIVNAENSTWIEYDEYKIYRTFTVIMVQHNQIEYCTISVKVN